MKKKIISLVLCISALFVLLVSCGDEVDTSKLMENGNSPYYINVYTEGSSKTLSGLTKTRFNLSSGTIKQEDFNSLKKAFAGKMIKGLEFVNVESISGQVDDSINETLRELIFDKSLKSIGENVFRTAVNLVSIEFYSENVPSVAETAFPAVFNEEGSFTYPSDKEEEYKKELKPFIKDEDSSTTPTDTTPTDTTKTDTTSTDTTSTNTTQTDTTKTDTTGTDTTSTDTTGTDVTTGTDTTPTDTTSTDTSATDTSNTDTTPTKWENGKYIKKLKIGEENTLDIPQGRTPYTLILNIPETFGSGAVATAKIEASKSSSLGMSMGRRTVSGLIPVDTNGNVVLEKIKTSRTSVFVPYGNDVAVKDITYLGSNETNKLLFFIENEAKAHGETGLEQYDDADGKFRTEKLDYDYIIGKLSEMFSTERLKEEREKYGLSEYDVDETGYFHVIFSDFGDQQARYNGGFSASGTVGVYYNSHIRDYDVDFNPQSNEADMFFVNTRYLEYVTLNFSQYLHEEYTEAKLNGTEYADPNYFVDKACKEICKTFIHEYFHYLMDANIYQKTEETGGLGPGPLFWAEGTAESASFLLTEPEKDGNLGFISYWINMANSVGPEINGSTEEDSSISYAVAPMFFIYIKETLGNDVLVKFANYVESTDDLNTIVKNVTGKTFSELYRDYLLHLFASVAGDSVYATPLSYTGDWSLSNESLFNYDEESQTKGRYFNAVVEDSSNANANYNENTIIENGNVTIKDGCISFIKWKDLPNKIKITSDASNLEAYVLYI